MTKKLVTILAEEFPEWPEGVEELHQWSDGEVTGAGFSAGYKTIAPDWCHSKVTRAQWEAERARILLESQPERDADVANVVDGVAARSAEDQALWDQVALKCYIGIIFGEKDHYIGDDERTIAESDKEIAQAACEYAGAFMAERAKRMKP